MKTNLLDVQQVRKLIEGLTLHEDLPYPAINCCTIDHVFITVEKLKKENADLNSIIESCTEFNKAIKHARAHLAPLDTNSLFNGLFKRNYEGNVTFSGAENRAFTPSESVAAIVLKDFDLTYSTHFTEVRFPHNE